MLINYCFFLVRQINPQGVGLRDLPFDVSLAGCVFAGVHLQKFATMSPTTALLGHKIMSSVVLFDQDWRGWPGHQVRFDWLEWLDWDIVWYTAKLDRGYFRCSLRLGLWLNPSLLERGPHTCAECSIVCCFCWCGWLLVTSRLRIHSP